MTREPSCTLVVTTIGDGAFLDGYAHAIAQEERVGETQIVVIPDRKSPPALYERCEAVRSRGIDVVCPDLQAQTTYLDKLGIDDLIPFDSDNRRNVGYLMAIERSADFVVSIDDDNHRRGGDPFFGQHAVVVRGAVGEDTVRSSSRWLNACDLLELDRPGVFPRGFPYHARSVPSSIEVVDDVSWDEIHLNAGLWLQEPDLDALTWLVSPTHAEGFGGRSVVLERGTWAPVNTQNTAIHRDAMESYYFIPMGREIGGMRIDRFGDIFSGYFAQACVRHLGHAVRIGTPIVDHRRNRHDYLRDATKELAGICLHEEITAWLTQATLAGSEYRTAYMSLADGLEDAVDSFSGSLWGEDARTYLHEVTSCMRRWTKAVDTLMGR